MVTDCSIRDCIVVQGKLTLPPEAISFLKSLALMLAGHEDETDGLPKTQDDLAKLMWTSMTMALECERCCQLKCKYATEEAIN